MANRYDRMVWFLSWLPWRFVCDPIRIDVQVQYKTYRHGIQWFIASMVWQCAFPVAGLKLVNAAIYVGVSVICCIVRLMSNVLLLCVLFTMMPWSCACVEVAHARAMFTCQFAAAAQTLCEMRGW